MGEYPPGSPFKAITGLIALQENVIEPDERVNCPGGYFYNGRRLMKCHGAHGQIGMINGIAYSCNTYFASLYRKSIDKYATTQEGTDKWKEHLTSFGLDNFLGYDLPSGRRGLIPDAEFYNRFYNFPTYKWYSTATISNSIGQGEINLTPI